MGKSFRFYRLIYTLFSFFGLVLILLYQLYLTPFPLFLLPHLFKVVGLIIAFIGAFGMAMMIRKYFIRMSGITWLATDSPGAKLEISGLHKYVRHPLYLGTFIFIWGIFLAYPYLSTLISNIIITGYTLIALKFEEKKLLIEFGDEYETYRKNVPRLIPRLSSK